MVLVVLATAALATRLFQIQVVEHAVWANEAANLVRSGRVVPYRRGRIDDARGRPIARDEDVYELELCYRDFRRGHPLGQVAHARAALEMRAVTLWEARDHLVDWALGLVELTPSALRDFARGEALEAPGLAVPRRADAELWHRPARASDLRFYVGRLLDFDRAEWKRLREALAEDEELPSFVELAARWRPGWTADALRRDLAQRLEGSLEDLEHLARELRAARAREDPGDVDPRETPLDELLADLEAWRAQVEDAAADRLFREATGFPAGRWSPENLTGHVELDWLARLLRWEPARLERWTRAARERWTGWRAASAAPTLVADLEARGVPELVEAAAAEQVQSALAALHAGERARERWRAGAWSWRELDRLADVASLEGLFDAPRDAADEGDADEPVLPFQDGRLRALDPGLGFDLLGAALAAWTPADGPDPDDPEAVALAEEWRAATRRWRRSEVQQLVLRAVERGERDLQRGLDRRLHALRRAAGEDGRLSDRGRLVLAEGRLDRAAERARFILKDLSSRPLFVLRDPDYAVVHLVARYPQRFAGFGVRDARVRVAAALDEHGRTLAEPLIGRVRVADVVQLHRQRKRAEDLRRLQRKGTRTPQEDRLLGELVRQVYRPDEVYGGSGVEGYFDPELRGRNGYEESRGLEERREHGREWDWYLPPRDGKDLTLTLDLDLQRAARRSLEHPLGDPDPEQRDEAWLANPVGALVLMTVEGDLLAAASAPLEVPADAERFLESARRRVRERAIVRDRCLVIPDFQPLGSVFKPFVAAWAIDRHGWDRHLVNDCAALEDGRAGYVDLHCWRRWGHGPVDLRSAIRGSCNAYFARLGESFATEDFVDVVAEFGFGEPTGVRLFGPRPGLYEHDARHVRALQLGAREKRMAGNGLGVIEGTPVQLARAVAGLATGRLPRVRLVARIGGEDVPRSSREVSIGREALGFVREAMVAVVHEPGGTAHGKGLDEATLGFRLAAKTGSADLGVPIEGEEHGVRKHTWVCGWFPAEDPRVVVVAFCYDTTRTASHTAVWLTQGFLSQPEVREWARRGGERP